MAGKFEVYEDRTGRFRWRLKAPNGQIIATGEAYESKAGALKGIEAVRRAAGAEDDRRPATVATITPAAGVQVDQVAERVWRVGFAPEPWGWPPFQYAGGQRWDATDDSFRTVYAGSTLLGCLLEVLAHFRPDPLLAVELGEIVEESEDVDGRPSLPPGVVPYSWLAPRRVGSARLTGAFCVITAAASLAALRPLFVAQAKSVGSLDFDAAALKDGRRRDLTQAVATYLHHDPRRLAGIVFNSRHGDELTLWAIFERPHDPNVSPNLAELERELISSTHPDVVEAFEILGLRWGAVGS